MEFLPTGEEMKAIDGHAIQKMGIPSLVLMERAALAAAEELKKRVRLTDRILVLAGTGNNGADGAAMVRILGDWGYHCDFLLLGSEERATAEMKTQLRILRNLDYTIYTEITQLAGPGLAGYPVFVDAIFGIGLEREITGVYQEVIRQINHLAHKLVLAVDIPSGVHSGNGRVMGIALAADVTVTFGLKKAGLLIYPGRDFCGEIVVRDIGFPAASVAAVRPAIFTYESADIKSIPKRPSYSNKGTFGKVLVIGGAKDMSGAAYFSALGAYRMGAGLVRILTVEENRQILQSQLPEAIMTTFQAEDFEPGIVSEAIAWADVIVAGPGLSMVPYARQMLELLLKEAYVPMVLDADALNIIAGNEDLTAYFTDNIIITPHPGEMSRLMKQDLKHILEYGMDAILNYTMEYGLTCVLKGASTMVSDGGGSLYINTTGNSGMAVGGSGDILAGMIGGLLAAGMEIFPAAAMGVYLHGLAGDRALSKVSEYAMLPRDILEELKKILKDGGREG